MMIKIDNVQDFNEMVTYSETHGECAYSQYDTAGGMVWDTDGSSAGRWIGFPRFRCSASRVPNGDSCGS